MNDEANEQANGGVGEADKEADVNPSSPDPNAAPGAAFQAGESSAKDESPGEGATSFDDDSPADEPEPDVPEDIDRNSDPVSVLRALAAGTISRDEAREYLDVNYPV